MCGKSYQVHPCRAKTSKHCSRVCHNKISGKIGGRAGKGVSRNLGAKRPDLAEYNRTHIKRGSEISTWKGDSVGYIAIHDWAHRHVGLKDKCEECGSTEKLEMSNRSGQYKRDTSDWWTLCKKCHTKFDSEFRRNGGTTRKLHRWKKQKPRDQAGPAGIILPGEGLDA